MDIPTLFVTIALVLVALAGIMVLFASLGRVFPGFGEWALSQVAAALGLVLLGLRGRAPALVSVLAANALLLAHPLLASRGFARFYGRSVPVRRRVELALFGGALALLALFQWVHPSLQARIVAFGATAAALHASAGLGPLASAAGRASRVQWVVSGILGLIGSSYLVRALYAAATPAPAALFVDPALPTQVLVAGTGQVVLVCGLLYLSFDRARVLLAENEGRLRMALESTRGGSWEVALRGGRGSWSPGLWDLLGITPGSVAPSWEAWLPLLHPEDRPRVAEAVAAAARQGGELEVEARLERHPECWLLIRGRTLPAGGGAPDRAVGIALDVSDRKRAEAALRAVERERAYRESAARFQALIEKSTEILYVIDDQRAVRYFSPGAATTLGWAEQEILGRRTPEFVHPEDQERLAMRFAALLGRPGEAERVLYRFRHRDGTYRLLDAVARNMLVDPVLAGVVVNARDVTEQHRLEQQLIEIQRLESVGQLAGGVAHDFNNLLTAILSGAEGIRERQAEGAPPLGDDLQAVIDAATRAAELTRQLLAFARRQPIAPTSLDPCALLRELELLVRRLLRESIELRLELPPGTWSVRADPAQLRQVILNLAVNARDAMPAGGRLVLAAGNAVLDRRAAEALGASGPGDWVRITVRDNGSGMTPEARAHLFEPFFTTKALGRGTGLGLAVVHGVVKQSEGAIAVESEGGSGTAVHVYLPRGGEPVAPHAAAAPAVRTGGSEAVLLVEDEAVVRAVAERALRAAGYAVRSAADAEEALALDRAAAAFDLLITDVVMPGMNGRQLADELRRRHPGLQVLFVSGFTRDAVAQHGVLDQGVELLEKPFAGPALLARVRTLLDQRHPAAP